MHGPLRWIFVTLNVLAVIFRAYRRLSNSCIPAVRDFPPHKLMRRERRHPGSPDHTHPDTNHVAGAPIGYLCFAHMALEIRRRETWLVAEDHGVFDMGVDEQGPRLLNAIDRTADAGAWFRNGCRGYCELRQWERCAADWVGVCYRDGARFSVIRCVTPGCDQRTGVVVGLMPAPGYRRMGQRIPHL